MREELTKQLAALSAQAVWWEPEHPAEPVRGSATGAAPDSLPPAGSMSLQATPAQVQLWLAHELSPDKGLLNDRIALRLQGRLDTDALSRALTEVVARHHLLRTVYRFEGGALRQYVLAAADPEIVTADFLDDGATAESRALDRMRVEALRPFSLGERPPMRVHLFRVGADLHLLLLTLHHIASDLTSPQILLGEVARRCAADRSDRAPDPGAAGDYSEAVNARLARLGDEGLDRLCRHWVDLLQGTPEPAALPLDRGRQPADHRGDSLDIVIEPELGRRLRQTAADIDVSVFVLMLTLLRVTLMRLTGSSDLLLAAPFTQRFGPGAEELIGPLLNLLALRNPVEPESNLADTARAERVAVLTAMVNGELPHGALVERAGERGLGGLPALPGLVFAYEERDDTAPDFAGVSCEQLDLGPTGSLYELSVKAVGEPDGSLLMRWSHRDLAGPAVRMLTSGFMEILRAALREPGQPVADLPQPFPPAPVPGPGAPRPGQTDAKDQETESRPPATATERCVAQVWAGLLGVEAIVDSDQSVFRLGAHSLLVARAAAALTEEFGTAITSAEIFRYDSVRAQAEVLDARLVASLADSDMEALAALLQDLPRTQTDPRSPE